MPHLHDVSHLPSGLRQHAQAAALLLAVLAPLGSTCTFTLWTGTLLSLLIAAAFVVSGWWWVDVLIPTPYGPGAYLWAGSIIVILDEPATGGVYVEMYPWSLERWNGWDRGAGFVEFPLYAVFLAVTIPTLLVWRFVPKFPRGHCRRCGYNLTGLREARCPECGQGF